MKIVADNGFARGLAAPARTMQKISMQEDKAFLHNYFSLLSKADRGAGERQQQKMWHHCCADNMAFLVRYDCQTFCRCSVTNGSLENPPLTYAKEHGREAKRSWQKCRNSCPLPELGEAHGTSHGGNLFGYTQFQTGRDSARIKLPDWCPYRLWCLNKSHCRTQLHSPSLE